MKLQKIEYSKIDEDFEYIENKYDKVRAIADRLRFYSEIEEIESNKNREMIIRTEGELINYQVKDESRQLNLIRKFIENLK